MNFRLLKKTRQRKLDNGTIIPASPPPEKVRYIILKDPLAQPILDYMEYMETNYPDAQKFWPKTRSIFGGPPVVYPNKGITGRQVYNIVRDSGDGSGITVWPHLFRETAGAEEARQNPDLTGILKVMRRIDVTERTAWRYMERYVTSIIDRSEHHD